MDPPLVRLPLTLDPGAGIPIYRQIVNGIREMIATGALEPGDRLPSIRELSAQLRINPSSAVKAYDELGHAGIVVQGQGRGTFVSDQPGVARRDRWALLEDEVRGLLQKARAMGFTDAQVVAAVRAATAGRGSASGRPEE
jgi:GntR family transcriptional regulator